VISRVAANGARGARPGHHQRAVRKKRLTGRERTTYGSATPATQVTYRARATCHAESSSARRPGPAGPDRTILTCCELAKISTLAAATLRAMGCPRAVALDGGFKAWREAGHPLEFTAAGG